MKSKKLNGRHKKAMGKLDAEIGVIKKAMDVLDYIWEEHATGEDWADLENCNAWGVEKLKARDLITVIKIDGRYRGRIKGLDFKGLD